MLRQPSRPQRALKANPLHQPVQAKVSMRPSGLITTLVIVGSLVLAVARPPAFVPDWLLAWRPQWLVLALVLWVQQLPYFRGSLFRAVFTRSSSDDSTIFRRSMLAVWLAGFFADGLLGEPLGLNGALFTMIAFYLHRFRDRLAMQTLMQRMIMIFMLVFYTEVLRAFALNWLLGQPWVLQPLTVALTSMLVWPFYDRLNRRSPASVRAQ